MNATAHVGADGKFSVTGITPGRYRLSASLRGRFLESATVGDINVTDEVLAIEPRAAPSPAVRLVFTEGGGTVFGVLQGGDGSPAATPLAASLALLVGFGVAGATALGSLLQSQLFGVTASDPLVLAVVWPAPLRPSIPRKR